MNNVTVTFSVQFDMEDIMEYLVNVIGLKEDEITQVDILLAAGRWAQDHFEENAEPESFTYAIDGEVVD